MPTPLVLAIAGFAFVMFALGALSLHLSHAAFSAAGLARIEKAASVLAGLTFVVAVVIDRVR